MRDDICKCIIIFAINFNKLYLYSYENIWIDLLWFVWQRSIKCELLCIEYKFNTN